MLTFGFLGGAGEFDPLILLLLALAFEAYVGRLGFFLKGRRHPESLVRAYIEAADAKLNRDQRPAYDRAIRGLLVALLGFGLAVSAGFGFAGLSALHPFGWVIELFLLCLAMDQRAPHQAVAGLIAAEAEGLDAARRAVTPLTLRDPEGLDEFGIRRAGLERLCADFGLGVVAPVFWYAFFGMPGLLGYVAIREMDRAVGFSTPKYRAFGFVPARLLDVLGFFPVRLAGLILALAAFPTPKAHPFRAFKTMVGQGHRHRRWNLGWPVGAMAGALGISLMGPRRLRKAVVQEKWIGSGDARVGPKQVLQGLYLYRVACLINIALVALFSLVRLTV
ncbi:MAG: cobalamin biosynthesis protein CobD/CbiB [Magnetovibrionaceae bacterium]